MAKIFTTNISYRSSTYEAVVCLRTVSDGYMVSVQIFDENINHLAPDGEIQLKLTSGLHRAYEHNQKGDKEFLSSIRSAVLQHLKNYSVNPY
jgi:hypothetical protein